MRKKLFVCLMLMMCVLAQAVPVWAAGVDISSLPGPPDDAKLISSSCVSVYKGENVLVGDLGSLKQLLYVGDSGYKAITFQPSTGKYLCGVTEPSQYTDEDGTVIDTIDYSCKTFDSFEAALTSADILETGDTIYTVLDMNAVVLFVPENSSIPSFKCGVPYLADYAKDTFDDAGQSSGDLIPKLGVSVVEKIESSGLVNGAVLRLSYSLPGYELFDRVMSEYGDFAFVSGVNGEFKCVSEVSDGYVDLRLDNLSNQTYVVNLRTTSGRTYSVDFVVDFITGTGSGFGEYTGSFEVPKVSILGLPESGEVDLEGPINITLVADMPVLWKWDGHEVSTGLSLTADVQISANGSYKYTASSEVGEMATGKVDISCLLGSSSMSGMDLMTSEGALVQTGVVDNGFNWFVLIAVGIFVIGCGALIYFKKVGDRT